jgi:hypothetical protein
LTRRHSSGRQDDVHLQTNQLRGKLGKPLGLSLRPSVFNRDALTFHIAELPERFPEDIVRIPVKLNTQIGPS